MEFLAPRLLPALPPGPGRRRRLLRHGVAVALALLGGIFGILGAAMQELRSGDLLLPFVGAPIFEEVAKPAGVYILLVRAPLLLRGPLYTAGLSALGGLAFAVVENLVYLNVYFPEHSPSLTVYRFTVALSLHVVASFMAGFGINQGLLASVKGVVPLFHGRWKLFFIAAVLLHAAYNITVTVLSMAFGWFKEM